MLSACDSGRTNISSGWKEHVQKIRRHNSPVIINDSIFKENEKTFQEQRIFDQDGIIVDSYSSSEQIKIYIKNNSDKDLYFEMNDIMLNGCKTRIILAPEYAKAGENIVFSFYFDSLLLDGSTIDYISSAGFTLAASEGSWTEGLVPYFDNYLYIDLEGEGVDTERLGNMLYDADGLKIISFDYILVADFQQGPILCIINETSKDLNLKGKVFTMNGQTLNNTEFKTCVLSGERVYDFVKIEWYQINGQGTGLIEEISFMIEIGDKDTDRYLKDIGPIIISY